MTKTQETKLIKAGIFTLKEALKIGISQPMLSRLVKSGKILRHERGIYSHPDSSVPDLRTFGFEIAQIKFGPDSAIGGLSALFYYNLCEQVPGQIWIIVPPTTWTKQSRTYRLIRTKTKLDVGIEDHKKFKIVSVERALIEGLNLSSKLGESLVLKAVRIAIQNKQTTMLKLRNMARSLDLKSALARYLEVLAL